MRRLSSWIQFHPRSRSRPGLRLLFAFLVLLLWSAPSGLRAASFTATLDRETVTVGETATLSLTFKGGDPKSIPAPPQLPNLQIANGGSSQSMLIENGRVTATTSQNFALTPPSRASSLSQP